jgi:hypothetical protein
MDGQKRFPEGTGTSRTLERIHVDFSTCVAHAVNIILCIHFSLLLMQIGTANFISGNWLGNPILTIEATPEQLS